MGILSTHSHSTILGLANLGLGAMVCPNLYKELAVELGLESGDLTISPEHPKRP